MNNIKYKCLIVDDEPIARKIINNYINEINFLELYGEAKNAIEAIEILKNNNDIDIILLDINMPTLDGITMLKTLNNLPQVIFTTAYSEYAVQSYELNAIDYLLKPFSLERFIKAVQKAKNVFENKRELFSETIQIRAEGKVYFINVNDILFCEAMRNYTRVFLKNGEKLITLMSLSKLESELTIKNLNVIRVHRSFIVFKKHITATKGSQILIDNHKIPIGIQYKEVFLKSLFF